VEMVSFLFVGTRYKVLKDADHQHPVEEMAKTTHLPSDYQPGALRYVRNS